MLSVASERQAALRRTLRGMPMGRSGGESFRSPRQIARRMTVLPLALRHVRSWPRFMRNYALGHVPKRPYVLRDGGRLQPGRGVDHVPMIEVLMRRDYGVPRDERVIVDLGASIGVFAVFAALAAPRAVVHAYEPEPDAFELLTRNVALNGLGDRIVCAQLAVGAGSEPRTLHVGGPDLYFPTLNGPPDSPADRITVGCTTLSEILHDRALETVDLLKVDVEGAEYELIYATPMADLERIAEIRLEVHDLDRHDRNAAALMRFLEGRGFAVTRHAPGVGGTQTLWLRRAAAAQANAPDRAEQHVA